jgi:hypothetical protein
MGIISLWDSIREIRSAIEFFSTLFTLIIVTRDAYRRYSITKTPLPRRFDGEIDDCDLGYYTEHRDPLLYP